MPDDIPCKVSERDKRLFKLIGEALNQPPVKVTKEEKLKSFDLKEYFDFLGYWADIFEHSKGGFSAKPDQTPEIIHQKAVKLGMIRRS